MEFTYEFEDKALYDLAIKFYQELFDELNMTDAMQLNQNKFELVKEFEDHSDDFNQIQIATKSMLVDAFEHLLEEFQIKKPHDIYRWLLIAKYFHVESDTDSFITLGVHSPNLTKTQFDMPTRESDAEFQTKMYEIIDLIANENDITAECIQSGDPWCEWDDDTNDVYFNFKIQIF